MAEAVIPSYASLRNMSLLKGLLEKMPHGRLLQWPMTGTETLDLAAVPPRFAVCDVHQATIAIPEYVLAAVLSWNVQLPQMDATFRQCAWQKDHHSHCPPFPPHRETSGQTLGIIGYGTIGIGVATRAAAMGMRVIAVTYPVPPTTPPPLAWIAGDDQLPRLMAEADFVVVACPLLPSTRGLVGREALSHMKPSGVLINIARGPIVDEDSLYEVLQEKRIGGAILDVWWNDFAWATQAIWPSKNNFAELPNVWVTPHASAATEEAYNETLDQMALNLMALSTGEPLHNVVRNASLPMPLQTALLTV